MKVSIVPRLVPVWDLPVRAFHWALVACVAVAAGTGFLAPVNWLSLHIWAGAGVGALVLARIVWGFTGGSSARFGNFTLAPSAVIAHLKDIAAGRVHREGGHNPLGAWMVLTLLAVLMAIVVTGGIMLGGLFKQGPGKGFLSFAVGDLAREPHELLAWLLLALVAAHILGMAFESWRTSDNLARAIVTGKKAEGFSPLPRVYAARRGLALGLVAAGGVALGLAGLQLTTLPPKGVPQVVADGTWTTECGDCHMAFHPTLLPAQSWAQIMASLDDHFGEDASLPADKVAAISAFLAAHSAETSDSFAANRLRRVSAERPLEITHTPFWTRRHEGIGEAVFKMPPVNSRQNCAACHSDAASGTFAPQNISIPQETKK